MEYRKLGRTGVEVGALGLGMEYLEKAPQETVVSVVHEAIDSGVNYFDLWMASPGVRDAMGEALKDRREKAFVAGHLGAVLKRDVTEWSRDSKASAAHFEDLLRRLGTDRVDAAMLFFVDAPEDFEKVFGPGGNAELAERYKKEGKARFIGMSSHYAPTALRAVRSGRIDILMYPVNPAFDLIPPSLRIEAYWENETYMKAAESRESALAVKRELYSECARMGVAVIAMKPFASGWLFNPNNPAGIRLSPVQLLHYALSQPGVVAAVPGCKSLEELRACLRYFSASTEEKSCEALAANELWKLGGKCMYCNHCLPCPAGIDVAATMRLIDRARLGSTAEVAAEYGALSRSAADCLECGDCEGRCPFGVKVIEAMKEGRGMFG